MPDTDRLINKAQGDDIITALNGITSRLQEMYTVDDALSSTSEHPVQNKVVKEALDNKADESELADKADKSDIASTQTTSGNPITLTDAAPINAESLVVELEPQQDLHGQSASYVGGAGKNKCPIDLQNGNTGTGMSWTIKTDADGNKIGIVLNGTHVGSSRYFATVASIYLESGNYYLSGAYNDNAALELIGDGVDIYNNNAENPTAFTISTNGTYTLYIAINTNAALSNAELKPMIRLATETDPTFAPYSNICPITGYTECEVDDVGKNLLDTSTTTKSDITFTEDANGYITASPNNADGRNWGYSYCQYTGIELEAGTYNLDWWASTLSSSQYKAICVFDTSDNMLVYAENFGESGTPQFTLSEKTTVGVEAKIFDSVVRIQIRENTAPQTYSPYFSTSATIQFGQTVYGGKVDVTDGGTSDEWNKYDTYSGWYKASTETTVIINSIAGKKSGTNQIYCNTYKYVANQGFGVPLGAISDSTNSTYLNYIFINDSRFAGKTVQECQAILESDGMYFVYQVETPTQLSTPPTPLKLLQGTNNLSTNGTTINLGYQPDNVIGEVKGEIEKCSPNPEFMHFEVNGNVVDAIPIIFDEAIHSYTVSGDNWKDKTFLCVECCDMRYGILQLVLSSDMAFVDSCGKGLLLYPYMRSIEQYIKISISLGQSYGYEISYQTTNTSSLLDYLKIRVRLFN